MTFDERVRRTSEVIERFRGKPFSWATRGNCIHLAKAQAKALKVRTPTVPKFSSHIGAVRALKKTGFDSLEALMDSLFVRIPPAKMIVGDIAMLPGDETFGALVIAAGGQKVIGWHQSDMSRMHPIAVTKAEIVAA